jgi:hypothetical protein
MPCNQQPDTHSLSDPTTKYYHSEQVIQWLGHPPVSPDSDEFIADENLLLPEDYYKQASEGVSDDADTVKHSNKVSEGGEVSEGASATDGDISKTEHMGPLTFDQRPVLEQDDELTASDDQTKLMRWQYRLGHLSFPKLKLLAALGEIPKRLANIQPPVCAGCAFGIMTKVPW